MVPFVAADDFACNVDFWVMIAHYGDDSEWGEEGHPGRIFVMGVSCV